MATTNNTPAEVTAMQEDVLDLFTHVGYPLRPIVEKRLPYDNPKLKLLGDLSSGDYFSFFSTEHLDEAKKFYEILLSSEDHEEFMQLARDARSKMNKGMFLFSVSWALLDSSMYAGVFDPPIEEKAPEYFIPFETIVEAVHQYLEQRSALVIPINATASEDDEEFRLAYFREDIGVNSHHWHWHLVYPSNGPAKDRKGELFYYMHQQMCARYDCERLSVGLQRVVPLEEYNFDDSLMGYSSHLALERGKRVGSRPEGLRLTSTADLVRWRERILHAIHHGYLIDDQGNQVPFREENGIDILSAVVEESSQSVNRAFYGRLHNQLHIRIGRIHDLQGKFMEFPGAIGDNSTAVRDPVFFRLHRFVDNLFNEYKETLPPYTNNQLTLPGVEVTGFALEPEPNTIFTSMKKGLLKLNNAIPVFDKEHPVQVEYEHLDHDPFTYKIIVKNDTGSGKDVNVRIFMAPKNDERGQAFPLNQQRRYFIEMDRFYWRLKKGNNTINRESVSSSVTLKKTNIPTFDGIRSIAENQELAKNFRDYHCNCGWPHHMLVPRGTAAGMDFSLFVMITDYWEDIVDGIHQSDKKKGPRVRCEDHEKLCDGAVSYCGAKNSKYPDKRPMGFPFDRRIVGVQEADFRTPNMFFSAIKVQFKGNA